MRIPDASAAADSAPSPLRVLIDGMPLHSGGGVQVAIALLEGLRGRGDVEWRAVFPEPVALRSPASFPPEEQAAGRTVLLPKAGPLDLLRARFGLRRIERAFAPDLVFTVFGPAYFRARAPHLVGFALPNLIYDRDGPLAGGGWTTRLSDAAKVRLLRQADHLVAETHTVARLLSERLGFAPDRVHVIGNSVNPLLQRFAPAPAPSEGKRGVLVPSAWYLHKNLETVPAVAAALRRTAPALDAEFRLTLDPESPGWRGIAARAEALGVADRVKSLGPLPLEQLAAAYREAAAVLLPTLREASTAVYPEAFHFERPLVTSDLPFARELCGDAAAFADPLDPEALAAALAKVLLDPAAREALVAAGRRQLASGYISPEQKFAMQMELVNRVARDGRGGVRG